jgi:hypothetical protein
MEDWTKFEFSKASNYELCESAIRSSGVQGSNQNVRVKLASKFKRDIFLETWVSIALGTALGSGQRSQTILWGLTETHEFDPKRFSTIPPGITATQLSDEVFREGGSSRVDLASVKDWIETEQKGSLSGEHRGSERMLIEFDQERAICLKARTADGAKIDEKAFIDLIRTYRKDLQFWESNPKNAVSETVNRSAHQAEELAKFFHEIFENAYKHGCADGIDNQPAASQLRFLRIRKITDPIEKLKKRASSSFPGVAEYVEASMADRSLESMLEVTISDFGRGILDQFLTTPAGNRFKGADRTKTFERLLYDNLTSNALDPSAGRGIQNALYAAKRLGAFVSLRSAEFHCANAFTDSSTDIELQSISHSVELGHARGTHWQFLWAPPY